MIKPSELFSSPITVKDQYKNIAFNSISVNRDAIGAKNLPKEISDQIKSNPSRYGTVGQGTYRPLGFYENEFNDIYWRLNQISYKSNSLGFVDPFSSVVGVAGYAFNLGSLFGGLAYATIQQETLDNYLKGSDGQGTLTRHLETLIYNKKRYKINDKEFLTNRDEYTTRESTTQPGTKELDADYFLDLTGEKDIQKNLSDKQLLFSQNWLCVNGPIFSISANLLFKPNNKSAESIILQKMKKEIDDTIDALKTKNPNITTENIGILKENLEFYKENLEKELKNIKTNILITINFSDYVTRKIGGSYYLNDVDNSILPKNIKSAPARMMYYPIITIKFGPFTSYSQGVPNFNSTCAFLNRSIYLYSQTPSFGMTLSTITATMDLKESNSQYNVPFNDVEKDMLGTAGNVGYSKCGD